MQMMERVSARKVRLLNEGKEIEKMKTQLAKEVSIFDSYMTGCPCDLLGK